jgi:hypothetical protein
LAPSNQSLDFPSDSGSLDDDSFPPLRPITPSTAGSTKPKVDHPVELDSDDDLNGPGPMGPMPSSRPAGNPPTEAPKSEQQPKKAKLTDAEIEAAFEQILPALEAMSDSSDIDTSPEALARAIKTAQHSSDD